MSMSRAAIFASKVAGLLTIASIAVAAPILGVTSVSADPTPPPATPTATTEGHDWIG
jgi:hypothetical protein